MTYVESDFDLLAYPVHRLAKSKSVMDTYKEFKAYPEFALETPFPTNELLRYIIYCYDPNTPFKKETTLAQQKVQAADKAGFPNKDGVFDNDVNTLMLGRNDVVNRMIVRFCRLFHPADFALVQATMQNYGNNMYLAMRMENLEGKDAVTVAKGKTALLSEAKTQLQIVKQDVANLFNRDANMFDVTDLVLMEENPQMIGGGLAETFAKDNKGTKKADE